MYEIYFTNEFKKQLNHWEAHLEPDWLLIWKKNRNKVIITLTNTGTHVDLF